MYFEYITFLFISITSNLIYISNKIYEYIACNNIQVYSKIKSINKAETNIRYLIVLNVLNKLREA